MVSSVYEKGFVRYTLIANSRDMARKPLGASCTLTPLVLRFMQQHPGLQVDLSFEDRYVNLVEQGVDLAIRMGRLADSSLGARFLGLNPWVLVGAKAYLAEHGTPKQPEQLAAHAALRASCAAFVRQS